MPKALFSGHEITVSEARNSGLSRITDAISVHERGRPRHAVEPAKHDAYGRVEVATTTNESSQTERPEPGTVLSSGHVSRQLIKCSIFRFTSLWAAYHKTIHYHGLRYSSYVRGSGSPSLRYRLSAACRSLTYTRVSCSWRCSSTGMVLITPLLMEA